MTVTNTIRWAFVALVVACAAAAASAGAVRIGGPGPTRGDDRPTAAPVAVPEGLRHFRSTRGPGEVPVPRRLRIPELGVDTRLEQLDRRRDGTVEVPHHWQRAGWYRDGPRPGEPGSAVLLGHVDSPYGPAVFSGLAGLATRARVLVDRSDGTTVAFHVTRVETYPRARFPVEQVYLPTLRPELRLITCGGRYLRAAGGYQSNVVVFATADRVPDHAD